MSVLMIAAAALAFGSSSSTADDVAQAVARELGFKLGKSSVLVAAETGQPFDVTGPTSHRYSPADLAALAPASALAKLPINTVLSIPYIAVYKPSGFGYRTYYFKPAMFEKGVDGTLEIDTLSGYRIHISVAGRIDVTFANGTGHVIATKSWTVPPPSHIATARRLLLGKGRRAKGKGTGGCGTDGENCPYDLEEGFLSIDSNDDCLIAQDELRQVMSSLDKAVTESEAQDMIQAADTGGDGTVNIGEFCGYVSRFLSDASEEDAEDSFNVVDTDGDGYIDSAELKFFYEGLNQSKDDDEIVDIIRDADADGDGKISFSEYGSAVFG